MVYRYVDPGKVETWVRPSVRRVAEAAVRVAEADLDLKIYWMHIRWFDTFEDQGWAERMYRESSDRLFFRTEDAKPVSGFMQWHLARATGEIFVASGQGLEAIARTVAHEMRHVWQSRGHPGQPDADKTRELERDARAYEDLVLRRLVWMGVI